MSQQGNGDEACGGHGHVPAVRGVDRLQAILALARGASTKRRLKIATVTEGGLGHAVILATLLPEVDDDHLPDHDLELIGDVDEVERVGLRREYGHCRSDGL